MSMSRTWILKLLIIEVAVTVYLYFFPNLVRGVLLKNYPLPQVKSVHQSWGVLRFNQSTSETPLLINGFRYWTGLGTHASSTIQVEVPHLAHKFSGACGLDDNSGGRGEFVCQVEINREEVWRSNIINKNNPIEFFSIILKESDVVVLTTQALPKGNEFAHANWVNLHFDVGVTS
jgi:hypothetical protein